MCRVLSHKFGVVQAHRTSSNPLITHDIRESKVCRALSYKSGVVRAHRTSSNPLKTPDIRESKVCRVLSHKCGVVQAHRTSSNPLKTSDIRESKVCRVCVGYLYTISELFNHSEPPRTFSNHFRVVQPPPNLLEPLQCRERKVCRSL